jgi:hypothetical protein
MVDNLEKIELPYAFSDYSDRLLENIKGQWNKTLPNEKEFYFKIKWAK